MALSHRVDPSALTLRQNTSTYNLRVDLQMSRAPSIACPYGLRYPWGAPKQYCHAKPPQLVAVRLAYSCAAFPGPPEK
eukprot:5930597-Pyramimonas_sp.AAC.1